MRVWIEQHECVGNGVCEELCPEMFHFDGTLAFVKVGDTLLPQGRAGTAEVPAELVDKVISAAEECPPGCVYLEA